MGPECNKRREALGTGRLDVHTDVIAGEIAARQLGLITRMQAIGTGITDNQIKKRTRAGKWRRIRSGVFTLVGAPVSWEQRLLAVVLAGGPGTVASHFSAAGLHEFPDGMREALEVTVAPGTQPRLTGVRIHRPALLPEHDVRVVEGIPVTSYARTLVDCTGCMSLGQIARGTRRGSRSSRRDALVRRTVAGGSGSGAGSAPVEAPDALVRARIRDGEVGEPPGRSGVSCPGSQWTSCADPAAPGQDRE